MCVNFPHIHEFSSFILINNFEFYVIMSAKIVGVILMFLKFFTYFFCLTCGLSCMMLCVLKNDE